MSAIIKKPKRVKIPTVIVDFDDVIVDFLGFLFDLFNSKFGTSINKSDICDWSWDTLKIKDIENKKVNLIASLNELWLIRGLVKNDIVSISYKEENGIYIIKAIKAAIL